MIAMLENCKSTQKNNRLNVRFLKDAHAKKAETCFFVNLLIFHCKLLFDVFLVNSKYDITLNVS